MPTSPVPVPTTVFRPTTGRPPGGRRLVIDPAIIDAFGTSSDPDIADRFGLTVSWVKKHRRRLRIPGYRRKSVTPSSDQHDEFRALLAKVSDQQLVDQFGGFVTYCEAVGDALGTCTDKDVAHRFGLTATWVRRHRLQLGIPGYAADRVTPTQDQLEEVVALLGKVSDRSLIARFGGYATYYSALRAELKIPILNHERLQAEAERWALNKPEALALLGKLSDSELSRRYGGVPARYAYHRKKAGIPRYSRRALATQDS